MSFLARLISDNSGSLEKLELGVPSSPATPKEKLHSVRVIVPSSINFRDISGSTNWVPVTLIRCHPKGPGTIGFHEYNFLLVVNCTRGRILHRFRDIAFVMSDVAIFGYPSCVLPQTEGFPWDDLRKISHGGHWMARIQNGAEILRKISAV